MQEDRRPTVTDEVIAINDDLDINYGVFRNGLTFSRAANSWRLWPMLEFVAPKLNPAITEMYDEGVAWTLCEHVSVVTNGWADYVFEGPDGPITQRWTSGFHNVENGGGYLPAGAFTRHFYDDFTLCCVIQKLKRTSGRHYQFHVVTAPTLLEADALFVHYATGARQRQTDFDIAAGQQIEASPAVIAIIGSVI
jgi:hypothetical protein